MIGVYSITNTNTGMLYIGSSVNVNARISRHKCMLKKGNHHCLHLQRAWDKYTEKSFSFDIVEVVDTEDKCRELEELILSEVFDKLYNIKSTALGCASGELNPMKRPEVAKKVSDARLGIKFTDEHKKNMSKARLGVPSGRLGMSFPDEWKRKLSEAKIGKPSNRKDKLASDITRENISKARTGLKIGNYAVVTCPYCGKEGAGGAMKQWHFNNCKHKEKELL